MGVKTLEDGNNSVTIPFPKNNIMKPNVPNIKAQFQYYANKTINSWNDYV